MVTTLAQVQLYSDTHQQIRSIDRNRWSIILAEIFTCAPLYMICIVHCWPKLAAICAVRIVCLGVLGVWGRHVIVCGAQLKHSFAGVFAWLALGWVDSEYVIVEDWLWSAVHLCVGMQILPWVKGPNVCSALYTNMYLAACMIALYWSVRTLGIRCWLAIFLSFSVALSIFVPDCARLCLHLCARV